MKREYPTTAEEAFEASSKAPIMATSRGGRARRPGRGVPCRPGQPVDTAWDIGIGDSTADLVLPAHRFALPACPHYLSEPRRGLAALRRRALPAARGGMAARLARCTAA